MFRIREIGFGKLRLLPNLIHRWFQAPGTRVLGGLILLIVAINLVGVWGIIYSEREARHEMRKEQELQAQAGARSLEALLASTRADFLFLSQSPPIAGFRAALESDDPMARRWRRLDMEGTVLLFLTAHPEVERITLLADDVPFLTAGRRDGAPIVLPSEKGSEALSNLDHLVFSQWNLGQLNSRGQMEVFVSIPQLLQQASTSQEYNLSFRPLADLQEAEATLFRDEDALIVPVRDPGWSPPVDWAMIWSPRRTGLVESVAKLTGRFRIALGVNAALLVLAALLGVLSVKQARRRVALEIENRQQAQIRELERQLMHSERLASVGRLAVGLAHEINNPLEGMSNYLSLLQDDIHHGRSDSSLEFAQKVQQGLQRVAAVTKRALTLADAGHKAHTQVDVGQIVRQTVDFVKDNRLFRGIKIRLPAGDCPLTVIGSPVTLGQAFLNLLLNAAEVSGQSEIDIDFRAEGGRALVTIADRGPGISEALRERIFEPFFSGKGSTGLGLSMCRAIVEQHNGEIRAANRPGGGAMFSIWIPLAFSSENSDCKVANRPPLLDCEAERGDGRS